MKPLLVLLFLAAGLAADAQTLKELLYSGKLKNDSNTVIRKTDDLSTKIDTGDRKKATVVVDTVAILNAPIDSSKNINKQAAIQPTEKKDSSATPEIAVEAPLPPTPAAPAKTPTRIWKEYTDSLVVSLHQDVLNSKKIKKDTYFITVDYELDTNGQVDVVNVASTPSNEMLANAIKQRMIDSPPQLGPVAKKVKRKYNFTVVKE